MPTFDPRLDPGHEEHISYVQRIAEIERFFREESEEIWQAALGNWDKFLALEDDERDPIDEKWRSRIIVPLPFSTTRTKVANLVEMLANVDPVWQVQGSREDQSLYEASRPIERQITYVHEKNRFRKILHKSLQARSVQGTAWLKMVYKKRAHTITDIPSTGDQDRFLESIQRARSAGAPPAPDWRTEAEGFALWSKTVNTAQIYGKVLEPPRGIENTEREIVEYEGPVFDTPSIWSMRMDPSIDELENQRVIIQRTVMPMSYLLSRADDDPESNKPYILANIMKGGEINEEILDKEEQELADKVNVPAQRANHPYFVKPVVLWEVWSYEETFQYSIIMNPLGGQGVVINKRPFELPLLTTSPNLFLLRNILVNGHAYGLSDYHESRYLFEELNRFRRLRMDRATLTTLGVYVKQAGIKLTEQMRRLSPGSILEVSGPANQAIVPLINDHVPPEAYHEPPEMKLEIEDATEVTNAAKGLAAAVSRVTGTEFQGRENRTNLKFKIDASLVEDELDRIPQTIISMFIQYAGGDLRTKIGGSDPLITIPREQLIQAFGYNWRMRGATKNIQNDLLVQQLTQALGAVPPNTLDPLEWRSALKVILEILDTPGWSTIMKDSSGSRIQGSANLANQATDAQNQATAGQAQASMPAPTAISGSEAQALGAGAGAAAGTPPPPTSPVPAGPPQGGGA